MPRHVINPALRSTKHEAFVKKLIQEFASSSSSVQPLILEEEIPSTKSRMLFGIAGRNWRTNNARQSSRTAVEGRRQVLFLARLSKKDSPVLY
jgi:hypothetical protein